jgi:2-polyprenyl-6-methoxyphenol hydroxylase-like FAD-dependent oxidoreductase
MLSGLGHSDASLETEVLIVGGGPVGLALAVGLRRLGVSCLLVERHASTLDFPRGRGVTVRTMEILRQWDLAADIEAAGLPRDDSLYVFSGHALLAEEFSRVGVPSEQSPFSPTERLICDQESMEVVLRKRAVDLGADLRFGTACSAWTSDADGVTGQLIDTESGTTMRVRAQWMIAADGARSGIRDELAIGRSGPGVVSHAISILIDAKLGPRMQGRESAIYRLSGLPGGAVLSVDNDRRWLLIYAYDPTREPAATFTADRCEELARTALGDASVDLLVVGERIWESTALTADAFRRDRVLLAGDAAHVTTPIGGLGMNCGIADVHNLAWKLAGVLAGWAPPSLLDSYEQERRPVALATVEASLGAARPPAPANGIVLGAAYASDVVVRDGSAAPALEDPVNDYCPTARPGHRAPHLWLNGSHTHSTLDLFGSTFVVLTDARDYSVASNAAMAATGVPVRSHVIDDDAWRALYDVTPGGAVLVRPDGHVAWRSATAPTHAAPTLTAALRAATAQAPQ